MLRQQPLEFCAEWAKGPRLNLDESPRVIDRINSKPSDTNLAAICQAGGILILERAMQARFHGSVHLNSPRHAGKSRESRRWAFRRQRSVRWR
jgi:hypothetical protein